MITRDLAPVAEYLEIVMPGVVARSDIEHYFRDLGIEKDAQSVISQLAEWKRPFRIDPFSASRI